MLREAVEASLDHLSPWMPWARSGPADLATQVESLRRFRAEFDLGKDFVYGIFCLDETLVMGGCGLHTRAGPEAREIGYWIRAGHINQGLATEAAAALTKVAFEVDRVERVEIHCDPDNVRSATVARKLGFAHEATLRRRAVTGEGTPRDTMIWTLFADEYPGSPAASTEAEAYDVMDGKLL
jgi:RimJ/RimL family protein N-acetyltransferase